MLNKFCQEIRDKFYTISLSFNKIYYIVVPGKFLKPILFPIRAIPKPRLGGTTDPVQFYRAQLAEECAGLLVAASGISALAIAKL